MKRNCWTRYSPGFALVSRNRLLGMPTKICGPVLDLDSSMYVESGVD